MKTNLTIKTFNYSLITHYDLEVVDQQNSTADSIVTKTIQFKKETPIVGISGTIQTSTDLELAMYYSIGDPAENKIRCRAIDRRLPEFIAEGINSLSIASGEADLYQLTTSRTGNRIPTLTEE